MATWEETKRAGQMAFTLTSRGIGDVYSGIGSAYQQILISGHLYSMSGNSMTQEIAEGLYPEPQQEEEIFYRNYFHDLDHPDVKDGIEPER